MTWSLSGELIETCSCNMLCPCWFGQADLMLMDQGYCATSLLLRVREGSYDGIDLAGQNAVVNLHFPGPTLFDGQGTGRVYIDESANDAQAGGIGENPSGRIGWRHGGAGKPALRLAAHQEGHDRGQRKQRPD